MPHLREMQLGDVLPQIFGSVKSFLAERAFVIARFVRMSGGHVYHHGSSFPPAKITNGRRRFVVDFFTRFHGSLRVFQIAFTMLDQRFFRGKIDPATAASETSPVRFGDVRLQFPPAGESSVTLTSELDRMQARKILVSDFERTKRTLIALAVLNFHVIHRFALGDE